MEIKVNGELVELGDSYPAITKKSIDIQNPSARFLDFTNKFNLPRTNANSQKFEHPAEVGSNGRGMDKRFRVSIYDVFELFNGYGSTDNLDKNTIPLQVTDQSKELFDALNISLNKINWDDEDTILNQTAIDLLDTVDTDQCWYWGKACFHELAVTANTDQTTGNDRCKYSRPVFLVNGLLKRAIEAADWTVTLPDENLAFNCNFEKFFFTSYQKTVNGTLNPAGTLNIGDLTSNDFEHADLTTTTTTIDVGALKTSFRFRGTVETNADIYLIVTATDKVDSSKVTTNRFLLPRDEAEVNFTSSEFQSDNGHTVTIQLSGTGQADFTDLLIYTIHPEESEDLSTNPWLSYKIKAYDNLPDLKYLDLFRLICTLFNYIHETNQREKTIEFLSLANISKLNAGDWSDKFIIGSEKITNKFQGVFKKNLLKYDNDLTIPIRTGEAYFETDNENLKDEGDYIKLSFGASKECTIGSNTTVHIPIYSNTTRITEPTTNRRLFYINSDKLQFSQIDWENLKDDYYETWFNSLSRIRMISADFKLSKLDVLKWKPRNLVYIDFFKTTFFVLEIRNFIPWRKTPVKLLAYGR